LIKAKAAKVKRLRLAVLMEEWQPQPRDTTIFPHRVLDWESVSQQAGGADIESHFAHFRGLLGLLKVGQNRYVED
jgi:hypothetical protein